MAVLAALIRGLARKNTRGIGNFWADLLRGCIYILLPLSLFYTVLLAGQGVVQTFSASVSVPMVESQQVAEAKDTQGNITNPASTITEQTIAVGPVASQEAIKQLGTNGGGYFNVNSAHPFENPTPFTNFLEMLAILLIPAALCYTFGAMIGDHRQGWAVLAAMSILFIPLMFYGVAREQAGNPKLEALGITQTGNMEGKEVRIRFASCSVKATSPSLSLR